MTLRKYRVLSGTERAGQNVKTAPSAPLHPDLAPFGLVLCRSSPSTSPSCASPDPWQHWMHIVIRISAVSDAEGRKVEKGREVEGRRKARSRRGEEKAGGGGEETGFHSHARFARSRLS